MMMSMDSTDDPKYVSTGTNPPDSDADQHSYDNQGTGSYINVKRLTRYLKKIKIKKKNDPCKSIFLGHVRTSNFYISQ